MARTVAELEARLAGLAARGRAAALGGGARLALAVPRISAAAVTGGGLFERNPDNVVRTAIRCGDRQGVLAAICQGNY